MNPYPEGSLLAAFWEVEMAWTEFKRALRVDLTRLLGRLRG